jgi:hypothetical protein
MIAISEVAQNDSGGSFLAVTCGNNYNSLAGLYQQLLIYIYI